MTVHSYVTSVVAPTCTKEGYTLHQCDCGESYQTDPVAALGHSYTASGTDTFTCTRCGATYTKHTHSYAETVLAPTCTEGGYTLHACTCGDSYETHPTAALGHDYVQSGTDMFTCTRCGATYTEHTHSYSVTVLAPTCTEGGYTLHECACGDSYQTSETAPLGHDYVETSLDTYTCTRCGASYSNHVHSYTETVVAPTCTKGGYTLHDCACGQSYQTNPTAALGHSYVQIDEDDEYIYYSCIRCGTNYRETIDPVTPIDPPVNPPVVTYSLEEESAGCTTERVLQSTAAEEHTYIYAGGVLLRETVAATAADGTVTTKTLDFAYDANGAPYSLTYSVTGGEDSDRSTAATYYYITNLQGDVMYLVDSSGNQAAAYTYDPYGKVLSSSGTMAEINPLRYRGYYQDDETGFYYLQSRYYDPAICRFINADSYASTGVGYIGYNAFAYCNNNPVNHVDTNGEFLDTVFDVISLGFSIVEVATNPSDPMAWAGLVGDVVDLIPFVSGVGETVKAVSIVANTADTISDVHKAAKAVDQVDDVVDAAKAVYKAADKTSDLRKATGSYEILYKSGKNYVGKGGFGRAIESAIEHASPNKLNNYLGDTVESIFWHSAPNPKAAFIDEFIRQTVRGVGNSSTYNKIWSPGKKIVEALF